MNSKRFAAFAFAILAVAFFAYQPAWSQATVGTGDVQGTITDQTGAVVPAAKITITNKDTGQSLNLTSSSAGAYNSGPLAPGNYTVRVEAPNFKTSEISVTVQLGVITPGNVRLEVGASTTVVQVNEAAISVNTEQATVQGVLNSQQIENLPIGGRNFLDLAQLEPGVQIQDGTNFDPTKVGFSSISFGGRNGRTARIEVDGVDVSDETVGTTTENIPAGALQEFQINQSSLDLSNELTSSGSINVVTKQGTNSFHGEALYLFRDSRISAALPGPKAPFQRNQMEGNVGGPIIKNKLFFFGDVVRIKQDLFAPVPLAAPFAAWSGGFNSPFREDDAFGKVDWQATNNLKMFYRFSYFSDVATSTFGAISFQPFKDKNYTRQHVVGGDFSTGPFTHSIRFSYLKFENTLGDSVVGTGLPLASFPASIQIAGLATGPNLLAPQTTPQSDRQIKYDGSKIYGSHIFRYGVDYNRLVGGGFAKFFSITPTLQTALGAKEQAFAATGTFTCPNGTTGASCPLNYPVETALIGNGEGFCCENPSFGFSAGRLGPDNRLGIYAGDSWKAKPNFTVNVGVRYDRDTGRIDSDLDTIESVNNFLPGIGSPVKQPNHNFAPQVGIAYDPWKTGKTVIRAGIGMYFENVIWNNVLFDRPLREQNGAFLSFQAACAGSSPGIVSFADGSTNTLPASVCSGSIGNEAAAIAAFEAQFKAVAQQVGTKATNSNFLPSKIASGSTVPIGLFAPQYKSPRSIQMNVGVQHQLRPGVVLSVDYIRNVATHYLLSVDANHSGDIAYFNKTAAQAAVTTTLTACGAATVNAALINCPGFGNRPATVADFAGNGLDSGGDLSIGGCRLAGKPFDCAFPGLNPNLGAFPVLFPVGRSVYNALDIKLTGNVEHPLMGIKHANFQFSYALSEFQNTGGGFAFSTSQANPALDDQDFVIPALDNRNPLKYFGDGSLDRRNQFGFGGYVDVPLRFRLSTVVHFDSPLSNQLLVPSAGGFNSVNAGEIFRSDFTGDGTVGDPVPGTHIGAFGRSVSGGNINNLISNYNSTVAGTFTPAGQLLISNGIFNAAQLKALGGVAPTLPLAPSGQVSMDWLRSFDLKLAWVGKIKERFTIEPSVSFYNVLNFANFEAPGNVLDGFLTGAPGSANGTTYANQVSQRIGVGTGVFGIGSPRQIEFGLRVTF